MSADHVTVPISDKAEMATLGSMILDKDAISLAGETITFEDFYSEHHRLIFLAILAVDETGDEPSPFAVDEELKRRGQEKDTGGFNYLMSCVDECASPKQIEVYARTVREKSLRRKTIAATEKIKNLAYNAETIEEVLETAEQTVLKLSERKGGVNFSPLCDLIVDRATAIQFVADNPGKLIGTPSGFPYIDDMTSGWQPGDLILLGARPSMGKTALALQFSLNAARLTRQPVAVFSLEMNKEQLTDRLIASEAKIDGRAMRRGELGDYEWERLEKSMRLLREAPLEIIDSRLITTFDMRGLCRRLASQKGDLAAIMVDYIQLARMADKSENRVQEMSRIGKSLKALAGEMNCPVIALSQLSRAVEQREDKRPQLSDLSDSGTLEADADVVGFLYRDAYYRKKKFEQAVGQWGAVPEDDSAELIIAKHRNGPVGLVYLTFQECFARFESRGGIRH